MSLARVGVIELGQPTLANALRSCLEEMGFVVTLYRTSVPTELYSVIESGATAPEYLILCADADPGGIIFPRAATEFDLDQLRHGRLAFDRIREHVFLPHKVVIGAGPGLGHPDCASAFVDGGVSAYFGAQGDVDVPAVLIFSTLWLTGHLMRGKSMTEACDMVKAADTVAGQFRMFVPKGATPISGG